MKSKSIVSLSLIIVLLLSVASQVSLAKKPDRSGNILASDSDPPAIVSRGNNATDSNILDITVERLQYVNFNATANQTIAKWNWTKNGEDQNWNYDNITFFLNKTGLIKVTVNANNSNGSSNTVQWNVTVKDNTPPSNVTALVNDTPTRTTVNLSWNAITGIDDLWGYEIFKDAEHLAYTQNAYCNVTGLAPNTTYEFKVRANDTYGNWGNNSSSISITTELAPTYSIWGYILNSSNMPINGSVVGNGTLGWTNSNESGYYALTGVLNGTYNISASKVGYETNYTIAIVSGSDVGNLNITLTRIPTYSISGYVLNASDGKSISGATVINPSLGSNTTNASGYYILFGATNGTWRITAMASGYTGNYVDANVNGANLTNQNITLQPAMPSQPHPGALKIVWYSPGAVDYVFVNETLSETITYIVATNQPTTNDTWYLDYSLVSTSGQSFTKTWSNSNIGKHVIEYTGRNANSTASFKWYINVYNETAMLPEKKGLIEVIEDALENHVYDIKIRMFEYKVELAPNASERAEFIRERNQFLHDEIAKRQMSREALRKEFQAGNITVQTYVAAMHQIQRDMKNTVKGQQSVEKIEKKAGPKNDKIGPPNGGKGKK